MERKSGEALLLSPSPRRAIAHSVSGEEALDRLEVSYLGWACVPRYQVRSAHFSGANPAGAKHDGGMSPP